jgi:photosystem II stability/assembly factor-like uncharacterized protein
MKHSTLRFFLVLILLGGLVSPLAADSGRWVRIGPDNGYVCALAAAPSRPDTLYAYASSGGVFRSTDGGQSWAFAGRGLEPAFGCSLAVDPRNPGTVYTGGGNLGVFKTTNGGERWIRVAPFFFWDVVAHPKIPGILYAGTGNEIRRTTNGGRTWRVLRGSPRNAQTLAIDPARPNVLYAGTFEEGLFKSTDGGASWAPIARGLDQTDAVLNLFIDPRSPSTLYLARYELGLLRSTDGGETWTPSDRGMESSRTIHSMAFDPGQPSVLYAATTAGLFKSADSGVSWSPIRPELWDRPTNAVLATASALLAGTNGHGIFRSTDQAVSWEPSSRGLAAGWIIALTIDPRDSTLYAAEPAWGVFQGPGGGSSWSLTSPIQSERDLPDDLTGDLAVDPDSPSTIYATLLAAVAKSTNEGAHWEVHEGLSCIFARWLVLDPRVPTTLYSGGDFLDSRCFLQSNACAVYRSTDGGENWSCIKSGLPIAKVSALAVEPVDTATIYAVSANGLYRSPDRGDSWTLIYGDLPATALAVDPSDPSALYAGLEGAVARSEDGGRTWKASRRGLPAAVVAEIEIDPSDTSTVYARIVERGVFLSTNSGRTWTQLGTGLEGLAVYDLVLDPNDSKTLYVGTGGGSVLKLVRQ